MYNWFRARLFNSSEDNLSSAAGEITPAGYTVVDTPASVKRIHTILFGTNPSAESSNQRLRQLTNLVHNSPLAYLAIELDSRLTYWPVVYSVENDLESFDSVASLWTKIQNSWSVADEQAIFGTSNDEPWLTLRTVWRNPLFHYRFVALLLALAYRTEEAA